MGECVSIAVIMSLSVLMLRVVYELEYVNLDAHHLGLLIKFGSVHNELSPNYIS
jgi:hypothetical protein